MKHARYLFVNFNFLFLKNNAYAIKVMDNFVGKIDHSADIYFASLLTRKVFGLDFWAAFLQLSSCEQRQDLRSGRVEAR